MSYDVINGTPMEELYKFIDRLFHSTQVTGNKT